MPRKVNDRLIKALFKYFIFIIDNLRVKIFINIDILISKEINLIISISIENIDTYNVLFNLIIILLKRPFLN